MTDRARKEERERLEWARDVLTRKLADAYTRALRLESEAAAAQQEYRKAGEDLALTMADIEKLDRRGTGPPEQLDPTRTTAS